MTDAAKEQQRRSDVLLVEDDQDVQAMVRAALATEHLSLSCADSFAAAQSMLEAGAPDLIVLDLGLPDTDGGDVMRWLQERGDIPFVILSARADVFDKVVGLELGAEDYITKPFDPMELRARIRAALRRRQMSCRPVAIRRRGPTFRFGDFVLDVPARALREASGAAIPLTSGEFDILEALLSAPGRVLSRAHLLTMLHGVEAGPSDRSIDIRIQRLRQKIEIEPDRPQLIRTVRGEGYCMVCEVIRDS